MSEVEQWPLGRRVSCVQAHPSGLVALEKPQGHRSHPNGAEAEKKCLLFAPYDAERECYETEAGPIHLLHRLDAPTSGLILLTADVALAEVVRTAFREGRVRKSYMAIVKGVPKPVSGSWEDKLTRERDRAGKLRVRRGQQGQHSILDYRVEAAGAGLCRIRLQPRTGRTHQLRVQAASRGFPILGDKTYGDFAFNKSRLKTGAQRRLYLHAEGLQLDFDWKGERVSFEAESAVPEVFGELVAR